MAELTVDLGDRSYPIHIGSDTLPGLAGRLREFRFTRISVISNPTVFPLYGDALVASLREAGHEVSVITIPDGEEYKDLLWAYHIYGELLKQRLDRNSALIALGGGVIGDMTGFVASTYMRGIPFIQVPTTLLAQVDSSVGGKTGVNHPLGKNMIGTFYQPKLVWADVKTLETLPPREFLAGLAEVIKYGVIWDDALFASLDENRDKVLGRDSGVLTSIIMRSCEIKAAVVSQDEREGGLRAILNYGHTIGHAIETATAYTRFLHGEAVAVGMCCEARLARLLGFTDKQEVRRICSLIRSYGLPAEVPDSLETDKVVSSMHLDKKAVGGNLRFILPEKVGSVRVETVTDTARILESLKPDS